jgi:hypothetical protein
MWRADREDAAQPLEPLPGIGRGQQRGSSGRAFLCRAPGSLGRRHSGSEGLAIVTLGIYSLVWYYQVHDEMKRHTGDGLGGPVALLLAFFIGIVAPFLTAAELGGMYERRGEVKPVSAVTALWYFPASSFSWARSSGS